MKVIRVYGPQLPFHSPEAGNYVGGKTMMFPKVAMNANGLLDEL